MSLILNHSAWKALHSAADPDWYTPTPYVEVARLVMGSIDLDPASDAEANAVVKATTYYTKEQNGLTLPWTGNVFLNPPGDQVDAFWKKLVAIGSKIDQFVWIGFSLEQLQQLQSSNTLTPLDFPLCIPRKRIAFAENVAKRQLRAERCLKESKAFKEKTSPSHANYIVYHGPRTKLFLETFRAFGVVRL